MKIYQIFEASPDSTFGQGKSSELPRLPGDVTREFMASKLLIHYRIISMKLSEAIKDE
jgi:hypothetical protein